MGFFSDLFGGKGSSSAPATQTVVTSNKLPAYMEKGGEQNFEIAKALAAREYPLYGGPRLAGFSPDQQAGFDLTRANVGSYAPALQAGTGLTADAATTKFPQINIESYMNPYTLGAIEPAVRELRRGGEVSRRRMGQQLARRGSYGFDRHALMEAENLRNENLAAGDIYSKGLDRAFMNAAQQFNADRAAQMQGGRQLADMGTEASRLGYGDVAALRDIGGQQQQFAQQAVDIPYTEFLRQFYHPVEQLNLRTSTLSGTPYGATVNQQVPFLQPNQTAQGIGAIAALAGGAGQLYSSGIFGK